MNPNIQKLVTCQTVLILIGGHAQRLLPFIKSIYPFVSYVLAIDAAKELRRLGAPAFQPRVRLFSLAQGHTALTLCKNLPSSVVNHIKSCGGVVASDGMGQTIALGRAAGRELVESRDFQQFVKHELIPTIRDHAGGALEEVRFLYLGSIAGGTYSGAELPIAQGLSKLTRKWSTAIVRTEFLVTGSLSFETLGERIWNNGGAALVDLLAYVMIDVQEVAAILRISTRSVWRLVSRGDLPRPIHFGRSARWRLADIEGRIDRGTE